MRPGAGTRRLYPVSCPMGLKIGGPLHYNTELISRWGHSDIHLL